MTLTNYWWLLIWLFTGGLALAAYFPKHREMVCGKVETRWGVVPAVLMAVHCLGRVQKRCIRRYGGVSRGI